MPDPDVITLDPSFKDLTYFASPIRRVWDQGGWLEGPAWSNEGRFLVLNDVIRSRALRYTWKQARFQTFVLTVMLQTVTVSISRDASLSARIFPTGGPLGT